MSDAWVAPEGEPERRAPVGVPIAGRADGPVGARSVRQPLPLPLRTYTLGETLDGGFATIKLAPRVILPLAGAFAVPFALLIAYVSRGNLDESFGEIFTQQVDESSGPSYLPLVLSLTLGALVQVLATAGIARTVTAWYGGWTIGADAAFVYVLRRLWVLVPLAIIVRPFSITFVGSMITLVAVPAAVAEHLGPIRAFKRSFRLLSGRRWASFGFAIVVFLCATAVDQALSVAPTLVAGWIGSEATWVVIGLVSMATSTLTIAFTAAATTLWYLDLRVRNEGLDLTLALGDRVR